MAMVNRKTICVMLAVAMAGCGTSKPDVEVGNTLADYVTQYHYTPFVIPRDSFGPGTIVAFEGKREEIKASNNDCLKLSLNQGFEETNVSIASTSYTVTSSTDLSAALAKGAIESVDLSGAFKDSRVKTVSIGFSDPKEVVASDISLDNRVKQLISDQNDGCVRRIFDARNYVIDRVLSVQSIRVEFKDASNQTIKLDAALLGKLGLNAQASSGLDGKADITANAMRMIGYRLWQYKSRGGMGSSEFERLPVDPARIRELRDPNS